MTWESLHEGILEEFTEAARFTAEDHFMAMSVHVARRTEQGKKDCKAYRARKKTSPEWTAKERSRHSAAPRASKLAWGATYRAKNREKLRLKEAARRARVTS